MAVLQIQAPSGVPFCSQRVQLDQVEFELALSWNERESRFYIVLYDSAGELVVSKKLVLDYPLLRGNIDTRRPKGELLAVDTLGTGEPAGLGDLGQRVVLLYIEAVTVAAGA